MDFHSMKRKELQELCKNHGIPANLSNVEMANKLSSIFKGSEKEKPMIRGRSCLKAVDDGACENDSDGVNRKVKKVRFSPENELIEFTKSIAKRGCRRKSRLSSSCLIVENACSVELKQRAAKSSPVIVTRSRGLQLLDGGDAEKKVTKRCLNGNDRVEKLSSDNEVRVTTRRALRNREMQDEGMRESEAVIEGPRKSERQRNQGSAKGIEDVPQSKQIGEEPQGAFRRSKRNAAKKDTGSVNEDVGKNENNNGGRLGRKQALSEVEASELEIDEVKSVGNGVALATGDNKEVGVITRRSLRNREITVEGKKEREDDNAGLRRSGRQSKQGPLGSHEVLQSQDIVEEPKTELRRSKRNVTNVKDTEWNVTNAKETVMFDENKNSGKVRLGRNQIKLAVKTSKGEAAELKIAEDSFASSNASNGENRACTKRLLRNKKVAVSEDINEGLKKMGGQTSMRKKKSSEEGPQNKQIEEELNKGLRRSKRTAAKMDDSQYLYQGVGKSKMVRKEQKTRSQFDMSVEASILEAMPETEIAALEKNEVGKEPSKATIRSSPQNSVMPLLEKATKDMEASSFEALSETETADESRLEVFIQVEEPTSISPRSSSFDTQFETEIAAESRLEVVNQVEEQTSASPRRATRQKSGTILLENVGNVCPGRATRQKSGTILLENVGNVCQNMNQNLSSHSTSNASHEVEVIKDDEMSEADELRISRHKTVMFYCNSSIDEQVDSNNNVANSELRDSSSKSFEEHEGTVAEEMRTSRRNASTQDHVNSSDETGRIHNATVNAAVEKESCNKKSTPAETSSQQLRVDATGDDKIVQPVVKDKDAGNKQPLNISESRNMALGVSLAEDITKINEQCTHVALLSGTTDTEISKEPASTVPLVDESCLEGNESEETRHRKNQVSPHNVGDRTGEVEEVKTPQLVSGVEYSCSDLVDLRTDTEVQIVDIPVTESKGFAEMVKISMEVNVENSLDYLEVANLAEQEPSEDFNVDRDSASIEANTTIDCYRSNGQSYLTAGVKEMQRKELTEIDYAESVGKEDKIAGENELVVIAEPLNRADEKSLATEVSLAEDRMSNGEKKSLEIGDCTQVAVLSCVEVTDFLNEPVNSESFINDTIMNSNKFEELAKQSKQMSSPKVGNRKKMEEVNSPQLENAVKDSFSELVTSHTDQVEQEKVVDEIKDFSDKVNISVEENTEKSLGGLVGHNLVHCKAYDGINVDREKEMEEVNSSQLENAVKESFSKLVTSHTDHVEQEKVLVDEIKDISDKVNISLEENTEKSLGSLVGHNLVHCKTYDGVNVDREKEMEEVNSPQLENAVKDSFSELVTSHTDQVDQEKVVDEIKDFSDKVNISLEENTEKSLGGLVGHSLVHCKTYDGINVNREKEMEEVNSPQLENAVKESFSKLVTSHTDHVEQEKVLVDEIKDISDKVNISLEENTEKSLGSLVGHNLVHCKTCDGVNVDREKEMEEVNSPQSENAVKESLSELVTSHTDHVEQEKVLVNELKDFSDKVNISSEENAEKSLVGLVGHNLVHCKTYDGINVVREREMEEVNNPQLENAVKESCSELVTSHTDHEEQEKVLVDEIKDFSDKVNISLEENAGKSLGGLLGHNLVLCKTYDGINVDREKGMEEVNSPQLENAVNESFSELVTSHTDHVEQEKVLVNELKDFSDKANISLEENAEKSLGGLVGHNLVHCITYDDINVDRDTVPFEINSPTKAYGCIYQSDSTADVKEKQTEEVAELQYAGSLSKDIGSTFQLVEHAVKGELSGEKKLAVNAADSVNSFATVIVSNDVLQDSLDDRPGENLEDGSQRFEKSGFVDSSEKHKCDASILELHAVNSGNAENIGAGYISIIEQFSPVLKKEPANTADWKKALQLGEQLSSKLRNSTEFVFVEGDEVLKDGDLEDQGIQVVAPDNDGKPSVSDATERRSETSLQEVRGSNAEGSVNNVEHEHFPPSESKLQKHGTEIHSQRTHSNGLETGRGLCECEDGSDGMEPDAVPGVLDLESSYCVSPSKCSDDEEQEEQLRLLFSTPIKDGSTCEENANACYMDSKKTSGQFTDASFAGEELRKLFTTCGDVSCPDGNYKCSDQSANTNGLESHRCLSDCECGSDSTKQEYQLRLLFSTPTSIRSIGKENAKAFTMDSNTISGELIEASNTGEELMKSFTTSDASSAYGKIKCTSQNDSTHGLEMDRVCECIEKFDCLEQEDQFRLLFSTPKSVRGTDEESAKDFYMDSNQRSSQLIEASNAVQTVHRPMLALNNAKEHQQGNFPCLLSTPFQKKYEVAKEKGVEAKGSNNCSDNAIAKFKVANCLKASNEVWEEPWISSEAIVLEEGFVHGDISQELKVGATEKRSGEDGASVNNADINPCAERPDSGAESSPSSSLKLNFCFGGNMEEKAQKSQVKKDDIKGCPTAMVDNDQIIANSNLLFDSPSKFHTMEERNEAAAINELDSKSNECTSTNEDNLGAIKCIGQPLVVAEMSQPSSCGLVDPQESIASSALHVNESDSSIKEKKCRAKAAEMELHTSEPCLKPTHQSTAEIDSDGDKGLVEDASLSLEKNGSREEQNAAGSSLFSRELNSLVRKSDTRSILIHATPYKQPVRVDLKENAPAPKGELIGTLTAARPEKRRPLKDLQWK